MSTQVPHIYCLSKSKCTFYFLHKQKYGFVFLIITFVIISWSPALHSEFIPSYPSTAVPAVLQVKQGPVQPCKNQFSSCCVLNDSKAPPVLNSIASFKHSAITRWP